MPDLFTQAFTNHVAVSPGQVFLRLLVALLLGALVAWIYVRTSKSVDSTPSFPITLALLAVLIAMVTQVIGDNIARAFSLVGALSIVRFRTVVRDTRDTAYVIFAVIVGMAVGAQNLWVAALGIVIVGTAAFLMAGRVQVNGDPPFELRVRMGLGHDLEAAASGLLNETLDGRQLVSVSTAKQGGAIDYTWQTRLRRGASPEAMVKALNLIEGVQDVRLERSDSEHV